MQSFDPFLTTQQFLRTYCADANSPDELINLLEMMMATHPRPLLQALPAIERLLAHPIPDDRLLTLITRDAQITLESQSEKNARAWLTWLAGQIRREMQENLLPFQPIRAALVRRSSPQDSRFPHDLYLYPTDDSQLEVWRDIWAGDLFYTAFMKEWNRGTCPSCQISTIQIQTETKYVGEVEITPYNTAIYYDRLLVYACAVCRLGWTERIGTRRYAEIDYP